MSETVIQVENVSKLYRLGEVGTGSLAHDVNRWWHRVRGKEDPYRKVGETNEREQKGDSDYAWALRGVSFEVKRGEVLGIIGRNGAGKSTLLKILSRITSQTEGKIKIKGRIASLLEVGTGFHPELTGRENIFLNGAILGMRKAEIARKFDEIVEFSGCARYIDTPVKRYSSGMSVRLAFAVAAHLEPEILIVDEVLAVGDAEFQEKCLGKMKDVSKGGRTVLFVSHNVDALRRICQTGILLLNGRLTARESIVSVIDEYLSVRNLNASVPHAHRYGIMEARIFPDDLRSGRLRLTATFKHHSLINNPTLGLVVYNEQNVPIFGSNTLFDPPKSKSPPCLSGIATVLVDPLPIWSGAYRVSLWLSDGISPLDHAENITRFNYVSPNVPPNLPPPNLIGATRVSASWKISQS